MRGYPLIIDHYEGIPIRIGQYRGYPLIIDHYEGIPIRPHTFSEKNGDFSIITFPRYLTKLSGTYRNPKCMPVPACSLRYSLPKEGSPKPLFKVDDVNES